MAQSAARAVTQRSSPFLVVEGRVQAVRHAPIVGARVSREQNFWKRCGCEVLVSADCGYLQQRRPRAAQQRLSSVSVEASRG